MNENDSLGESGRNSGKYFLGCVPGGLGLILEKSELNTFLVIQCVRTQSGEMVSQPRDLNLGGRKYGVHSGKFSSGEVILWSSDQTWRFF